MCFTPLDTRSFLSKIKIQKDMEVKNPRVDLGPNTYAFFNMNGSFVMQERFLEKHKSALLSGLFRCVYFKDPDAGSNIGWWCKITIVGKQKARRGKKVYFKKDDLVNIAILEIKANAEITQDKKKIELLNNEFEQLEICQSTISPHHFIMVTNREK